MLIGIRFVWCVVAEGEKQIYNVDQQDYDNFILTDNDEVSVEAVLGRFSNKVEIHGAVYRAGMYQLDSVTGTIKADTTGGRSSWRCFS